LSSRSEAEGSASSGADDFYTTTPPQQGIAPGNKLSSFGEAGGPASRTEAPLKATPYPTKSETPPNPYPKAETMLRGFTKDGVVHILGNATLPDGVFVKIIRE